MYFSYKNLDTFVNSYFYSYVPAAVEISRTASSSGHSNLLNDHRNHTSKNTPDGMHQGHSYGVSTNNGGHPVDANFGFHDLNGKSNSQRSHLSHPQHSSYIT